MSASDTAVSCKKLHLAGGFVLVSSDCADTACKGT